jgi:hypothetical protein
MTTFADLLSRADRQRLADRMRDLEDTARLMREPGSLAAPGEPTPLHQAVRADETALRDARHLRRLA